MRVVISNEESGLAGALARDGRTLIMGRDGVSPILHFGMRAEDYESLVAECSEVDVVVFDPSRGVPMVREACRLAQDAGVHVNLWIAGGAFPWTSGVQEPVRYEGSGAPFTCESLVLARKGTVIRVPAPIFFNNFKTLVGDVESLSMDCDPMVADVAPGDAVLEHGQGFRGRGGIYSVAVMPPLSVGTLRRELNLSSSGSTGLLDRLLGHSECMGVSPVVRVPSEGGSIPRNDVLRYFKEAMDADPS